ncbi:unnamed protein product [Brassica napus]|uniref:(rape) hypothetical protein n=1 Tax=Brassica napus TaxID=3708 RepID=A0A816QMA9_BRANA|nr:unnamed protein product [Brassica napus]
MVPHPDGSNRALSCLHSVDSILLWAFHPKFAQDGRLFASFNCDKSKWPGRTVRCSCNCDVNCDPSSRTPDSGSQSGPNR